MAYIYIHRPTQATAPDGDEDKRMELYYAIADALGFPQEHITITNVIGNLVWFDVKGSGRSYTCKTVRGGKFLKKHSIRIAD